MTFNKLQTVLHKTANSYKHIQTTNCTKSSNTFMSSKTKAKKKYPCPLKQNRQKLMMNFFVTEKTQTLHKSRYCSSNQKCYCATHGGITQYAWLTNKFRVIAHMGQRASFLTHAVLCLEKTVLNKTHTSTKHLNLILVF